MTATAAVTIVLLLVKLDYEPPAVDLVAVHVCDGRLGLIVFAVDDGGPAERAMFAAICDAQHLDFAILAEILIQLVLHRFVVQISDVEAATAALRLVMAVIAAMRFRMILSLLLITVVFIAAFFCVSFLFLIDAPFKLLSNFFLVIAGCIFGHAKLVQPGGRNRIGVGSSLELVAAAVLAVREVFDHDFLIAEEGAVQAVDSSLRRRRVVRIFDVGLDDFLLEGLRDELDLGDTPVPLEQL